MLIIPISHHKQVSWKGWALRGVLWLIIPPPGQHGSSSGTVPQKGVSGRMPPETTPGAVHLGPLATTLSKG